MKLANLAKGVLVADQILPEDLNELAAQGIKTILCHRPDGEGADQPNFAEIAQAAKALKIKTHYIPVVSGKISDADVAAYRKIIEKANHSPHLTQPEVTAGSIINFLNKKPTPFG